MSDGTLLPQVRDSALAWLGGYLPHLGDPASMQSFIRAPALGGDSAISGAVLMALDALHERAGQG